MYRYSLSALNVGVKVIVESVWLLRKYMSAPSAWRWVKSIPSGKSASFLRPMEVKSGLFHGSLITGTPHFSIESMVFQHVTIRLGFIFLAWGITNAE